MANGNAAGVIVDEPSPVSVIGRLIRSRALQRRDKRMAHFHAQRRPDKLCWVDAPEASAFRQSSMSPVHGRNAITPLDFLEACA
jgi:hypothetical protein